MAADDISNTVQLEGEIGDSDDHIVVGIAMAVECRSRLQDKA
jgi:hypothetical protein